MKLSKNIIYCILFLCFGLSWLSASSYNPQIKNNIIYNVDGNSAFVNLDKTSLYKYKSGTISHTLKFKQSLGTNRVIVSKAVIDEVYSKYAKIKFQKIHKIKPKILYDISQNPQNGDLFVMDSERNLHILIAPNYESYAYITSHYRQVRFLPIDLFAMSLKASSHALPSKEDFSSFCNLNLVSDVIFALENKLVFVDCNSLKPYKQIAISSISKNPLNPNITTTNFHMPFFTNIQEIKNSIFDFSHVSIDYTKYYKSLLGI